MCACGRELPCNVAIACTRTHERHASALAMLHETMVLPVITSRNGTTRASVAPPRHASPGRHGTGSPSR